MVKMTKGVGINNKYWVFITGFTGASYTVNIQNTKTCATWSKGIEPNATAAFRDYEAFPLNRWSGDAQAGGTSALLRAVSSEAHCAGKSRSPSANGLVVSSTQGTNTFAAAA